MDICTKCGQEFENTSSIHTTCYYCRTRLPARQISIKQLKNISLDLEAALKDPLVQKIVEGEYEYRISFKELNEGIIALSKYVKDKESVFADPEFLKKILIN